MQKSGWLRIVLAALVGFPAALFAVAWVLTIGTYPVPRTTADDPSLPVIENRGYRFHGQVFGSAAAKPVIVLHGGPGWDYRSLLPLQTLSNQYRVIFYDQRGSGLSPRVAAEELSLESSLDDLDAMVDKFGDDRQVILIGHSWGAMLVAAYIAREPGKVSQAILAEPGFLSPELFEQSGLRLGPRMEVGYLAFASRRWFESLHIDGPDAYAAQDYFLGAAASHANPEYYCNDVIPDVALSRWRAGAIAMGAVLGSTQDEQGNPGFDVATDLAGNTVPVLLLASECNDLIGISQQQRHQRLIGNSRLVVIANSGHMMFAEQPEASIAAVRQFLSEDR